MTVASRLASHVSDEVIVRVVNILYPRVEPELGRLDDICGQGGVMIDVGAWYGPWALRLARRADRLIAIEPTSRYRTLTATLPANAEVLRAAASDHAGEGELWSSGTGDGAEGLSSLQKRGLHDTSQTVPLIRIDDLAITGLTFIKIDVEGHELAVLRGAEATIRRDRPRMLVEVDSQMQAVDPLIETLNSWDYVGWILHAGTWKALHGFDLARRQAATVKVANRGLAHRLCWPYPRYINSVLFLPTGAAPGSQGS